MNQICVELDHLHTVLGNLNVVVYVADMETHELLYLNQYDEHGMVELSGRYCWEVCEL